MSSSLNGTGVTFSDATTQASAWVGCKGQVFTSSGTFTIPAGVTALKATVVGGGGGGGGSQAGACFDAGGGGGGGCAIAYLTGLTPGNTISVAAIGGAGSGGSSSGGNGTAGGTSTISSGTQTIPTVSATGGALGTGGASGVSYPRAAGGAGSGGSINLTGGAGDSKRSGDSIFGGQQATLTNTNGFAGAAYGAGGSSAGNSAGASHSGAAGATGIVIFEW